MHHNVVTTIVALWTCHLDLFHLKEFSIGSVVLAYQKGGTPGKFLVLSLCWGFQKPLRQNWMKQRNAYRMLTFSWITAIDKTLGYSHHQVGVEASWPSWLDISNTPNFSSVFKWNEFWVWSNELKEDKEEHKIMSTMFDVSTAFDFFSQRDITYSVTYGGMSSIWLYCL